ncbi:MAG: hypothetical protein ACRENG_07210 [bacterium]
MNHEVMLEDIKAELDHLDAAALQSIREIINQAKRPLSDRSKARQSSDMPLIDIEEPLSFVGENLTPEKHEQLSLKERAMLKRRLKERNYQWLQAKFSALDAAWLVVVDGQVIASGKSLKDKPRQRQILEIGRRTGKFPFVFVNDEFITIEESTSSWHATKQAGDYYPTLPVTLRSASVLPKSSPTLTPGLLTPLPIMIFLPLIILFVLKPEMTSKRIYISIDLLITLTNSYASSYLQILANHMCLILGSLVFLIGA